MGASLGLGLEVGRHVRPWREGRLCGRLPIWSLNLQAVRQLRSHPAAKRRRLRAAEFAWNRITHEHVYKVGGRDKTRPQVFGSG